MKRKAAMSDLLNNFDHVVWTATAVGSILILTVGIFGHLEIVKGKNHE